MKRLVGALLIGLLGSQLVLAEAKVLSESYPPRSAWDLNNSPNSSIRWNRISMTFEVENKEGAQAEVVNAFNARVKSICDRMDKQVEIRDDGTFPGFLSLPDSKNNFKMIYSALYHCN